MTAPAAIATSCHGTPPATSVPTMSGAVSAPTLNDTWSRFMARPRPSR